MRGIGLRPGSMVRSRPLAAGGPVTHTPSMSDFSAVWDRQDEPTRQWLIEHNGEVLPEDVLRRLTASAGNASELGWLDLHDPEEPILTDETVDWIESVANGE